MDIRKINDQVSVSPQITVEDIVAIQAAGFTTIINNRPDGEAPDQTPSDEIKAAAEAAGLKYVFIPMGRDGVSPDMIAATQAVLSTGEKTFAYCRTGTRSTNLWALSQAGNLSGPQIIEAAAQAGYDISNLAGYLNQ